MKRPTLSGYENEVAMPNIPALVLFSDYFGMAIDTLVKVDLTVLTGHQLYMLEHGEDVFLRGEVAGAGHHGRQEQPGEYRTGS